MVNVKLLSKIILQKHTYTHTQEAGGFIRCWSKKERKNSPFLLGGEQLRRTQRSGKQIRKCNLLNNKNTQNKLAVNSI